MCFSGSDCLAGAIYCWFSVFGVVRAVLSVFVMVLAMLAGCSGV